MIASPTEGAATETLRVHRCQTIDECSKRLRRLLRKRDRPGKQQAEERIGPAHPFCVGAHKVSPRAGQFARFVWRQSKRIDREDPAHRVHLESIHSTFSDENALEPPLTDSRAFLAQPETSPSRLTSSRRPNLMCSSAFRMTRQSPLVRRVGAVGNSIRRRSSSGFPRITSRWEPSVGSAGSPGDARSQPGCPHSVPYDSTAS